MMLSPRLQNYSTLHDAYPPAQCGGLTQWPHSLMRPSIAGTCCQPLRASLLVCIMPQASITSSSVGTSMCAEIGTANVTIPCCEPALLAHLVPISMSPTSARTLPATLNCWTMRCISHTGPESHVRGRAVTAACDLSVSLYPFGGLSEQRLLFCQSEQWGACQQISSLTTTQC